MALTYKDSGVDLELYEQAMQRLPRLMHRTFTPRVVRNDGGFASLYALDFAKSIFSRKLSGNRFWFREQTALAPNSRLQSRRVITTP